MLENVLNIYCLYLSYDINSLMRNKPIIINSKEIHEVGRK